MAGLAAAQLPSQKTLDLWDNAFLSELGIFTILL